MVTHLTTKAKKILVLVLYLGLLLIFLICLKFPFPCLSKIIFHLACPACGMTRAFKAILNLQIAKSFSYNILAFPLFLIFLFIFIINLIDLIFNKDYLTKVINFIIKLYPLIIILLILSMIINNIRHI